MPEQPLTIGELVYQPLEGTTVPTLIVAGVFNDPTWVYVRVPGVAGRWGMLKVKAATLHRCRRTQGERRGSLLPERPLTAADLVTPELRDRLRG